jgi:hypothetical protein
MLLYYIKKENDNKLWDLYVSVYPNFTEDNFLNFENFKKEVTTNIEIEEKESEKKRIEEIKNKVKLIHDLKNKKKVKK